MFKVAIFELGRRRQEQEAGRMNAGDEFFCSCRLRPAPVFTYLLLLPPAPESLRQRSAFLQSRVHRRLVLSSTARIAFFQRFNSKPVFQSIEHCVLNAVVSCQPPTQTSSTPSRRSCSARSVPVDAE